MLSRIGLALGVLLLAGLGLFPRIDGHAPWITSRAAGVTAFVALSLDVVFGLFVSTRAADRWLSRRRSADAHRFLSTAGLGLTAAHALALLADRFVSLELVDLLVPFASSRRGVALGVLAAYGAALLHASSSWRRQIGAKAWRRVHALSFFVFVAALLHGLWAGSDSRAPGMLALYLGSATAVGLLGVYRATRGLLPTLPIRSDSQSFAPCRRSRT